VQAHGKAVNFTPSLAPPQGNWLRNHYAQKANFHNPKTLYFFKNKYKENYYEDYEQRSPDLAVF
jgi:hypothetical protein